MAYQFQTIRQADFGKGIDQESAENNIPEGYIEDATNTDPRSTGQLNKRLGYQGFAGYVPLRVTSITYSNSGTFPLCLKFDSSVKIPVNGSTPLIVQGKTSNGTEGDFLSTSESIKYYETYSADIRETFLTGTNTLNIPASDSNLSPDTTGEWSVWTGVSESTNASNLSNTQFLPDSVDTNQSTFNLDINYTNSTGSTFPGFVFFSDKSDSTGLIYNHPKVSIPSAGLTTVSIPQATHGLNTTNILIKTFEDTGTEFITIEPDAVRLVSSNGNIEVDFINNSGSPFDAKVSLTAVSDTNLVTTSVAAGTTGSVTIDAEVVGGSEFIFFSAYTGSGTLERVVPDSISYDSANNEHTVSFTNSTGSSVNFEVYWEFAEVASNELCVPASSITTTFSDTEPQLTVWGLCHEDIYGQMKMPREGWVTHIDSYIATAENRLISGLGGNLFSAELSSLGTNASTYLMPTYYPRLNNLASSDITIGPAFYATGATPGRTRGFITGTTFGDNQYEITSIAFQSGNTVRYTLSVPSLVISGTLSTIISTVSGFEDTFTAAQCGYAVHNGTFKITAVSSGTDELFIDVENTEIDSTDFDEGDVGGQGGIFTDELSFTMSSNFIIGDDLTSTAFLSTDDFSITKVSGSDVLIDGVDSVKDISAGIRFTGTRTSNIVPLRDAAQNQDTDNIVQGDMLTYTEISRQLRVKSINILSDESVTITGDSTEATVTGISSTVSFRVGDKLLIKDSSSYNGTITITELTSATSIKFSSTISTTESGTIVGNTIEIDEQLTFTDIENNINKFTVHSRWIPIEIPTDSFDQTDSTRVQHFDAKSFTNQTILRSTMMQDSLFATNQDDEVYKYDGVNIYRAGLFRWQPGLFTYIDISATSKITLNSPNIGIVSASGNIFKVTLGEEIAFNVGDQIVDSTDDVKYFIESISDDGTNGLISVNKTISGGTAAQTLTRISRFKYYFRLNAVDINNNITASAVTGADDFVAELSADAAVQIKLTGMPTWDIYDYDRLEVQIYRTQANQVAPFFRIATIALDFDNSGGYIDYIDTDSDADLFELDEVNTALKGAELGQAWDQPMRAKYCTSADNKLVLANLKDYPQLDIRWLKEASNPKITTNQILNNENDTWLFRKDNTDTGTVTNMTDRVTFFFAAASGTPITGITGTEGTSFLVTTSAVHFLSVGDWVYLTNLSSASDLTYAGWWQVNVVDSPTTFTVNYNGSLSGAATSFPTTLVTAATKTDVPVMLGTDFNYGMLNGNEDFSSPSFIALRRLANAINAVMRKTDKTITGQENFKPWMTAAQGNEFNANQIIVRQPGVFDTTMEVVLPTLGNGFDVYVNNIRRSGNEQVSAETRIFPSRLLVSYSNYPEIFDNALAVTDSESDSVIDINSADGQEITAVIPFFGDAAFRAARKSGVVVVFKTNSIYLVDLSIKDLGQVPIQKLESRGKGCDAPFSVASTRDGIVFANKSGIYRLNRRLQVEYLGVKYERKYQLTTNFEQLELATGHHFNKLNQYKLSYPLIGETENSTVAVYDHTREREQPGTDGSWTTYNNHPVTGWANLQNTGYFASTIGRVFSIRETGENSDYRDDDQAINMDVTLRALDFGVSGRRKIFSAFVSHFRTGSATTTGTALTAAIDLTKTFQTTDSFQIINNSDKKLVSFRSVIDNKVGIYIQLKYNNNKIDEPVDLSAVDFRVGIKKIFGIAEAADTTS